MAPLKDNGESIIARGPGPTPALQPSPQPSPQPSWYLGPEAQLVNGVLGLSVLGEELVVVLLQERESRAVTAQAPCCKAPHREPIPSKRGSGFPKVKELSNGS